MLQEAYEVVVRVVVLTQALCASTPRADCADHVIAAVRAGSTHDVDPALLLAVARRETHYQAHRVSHVRGKMFCGVMQTQAGRSVAECRRQADLDVGYMLGAEEMRYWLKRCRGRVRCALASHRSGNVGMERCGPKCTRYVNYVMRWWDYLKRRRGDG